MPIRAALRGEPLRPVGDLFEVVGSRAHGHVQAVSVAMQRLGFRQLLCNEMPQTGLFVGFVPGFPVAHSQGETLDELNLDLREVIGMLLEAGEPALASAETASGSRVE